MKISFAATNPCHVYPLALELQNHGALGCYYSGYPTWKLGSADGFPVKTHSWRPNIVYGLLKFAPERFRPSSRQLFLWQAQGFDHWTGANLEPWILSTDYPGNAGPRSELRRQPERVRC